MKRWFLLLPILILHLFGHVGHAQLFLTTFWQQVTGAVTLGSFSITGVTGTSDATADAWLVNDTSPTINFGSSSNATSYDVVIKDSAGTTTICSLLGTTSTTAAVSGCSLSNGTSYKAYVTSKVSGSTLASSNDGFSFTVDNTTPTTNTITGITGASDSTADIWLVGGLIPTVNWNAFTGASSYDVTIKDAAGSSTVCSTTSSATTSYNFSSCTLVDGTSYRAYVTAKSPSGFNTVAASNNGYSFSVDNTAPGTFSITGITGGTDVLADAYLSNGSDPTVNFGNSTNVYRYDILIKDSSGTTTVCSSLSQTTSPVAVTCGLTNGQTYKAYVTAKSISTYLTTNASNNGYSFTVGAPAATQAANFSIRGATGGSDSTADNWLTNGTTVTARWEAAAGAQNYSVTIRNSSDTADVCSTQTTNALFYQFSSCPLTTGTTYLIKVVANNSPAAPRAATNNGFPFQVITPGPGSFLVTGATGGTDSSADDVLMNGTTVTANWGASSGATSYDVTIRNSTNTADVCATQNTTSTSYTFTGCALSANTDYLIKVIAKNTSGSVAATNSPFSFLVPNTVTFCPTGSSSTKALIIYDSGGAAGNYANGENCTFNVVPTNYLYVDTITLNFASFASADNTDALKIYKNDIANQTAGNLVTTLKNTSVAPADQAIVGSGKMSMAWSTGGSGVAAGYNMNYRVLYYTAGAPTISGVTGGTDSVADNYLGDNSSGVTVNWSTSDSTRTASYDVVIRDSSNSIDICAKGNTTSTSYSFTGCTLSLGTSYVVLLYARNFNGLVAAASNNPYTFTYDSRPQGTSITGLTGAGDTLVDNILENTTVPTLNWEAAAAASSYDVVIYENDGYTEKCPRTNVAAPATSYSFSSCTLTLNTYYKAEVVAKNASGLTKTINSPYSFRVRQSTWRTLASAGTLEIRAGHTAVWTGSEMIVWGGSGNGTILNTGGRYNPTTDSWTPTSGTNAPVARQDHSAAWTGTEMFIWGGVSGGTYLNSGGRYNPGSNSWVATSIGTNVPSARSGQSAVWTGSEVLVWGGCTSTTACLNIGSRYNPTANSWTPMGLGGSYPTARGYHTAVWTGTEMIIWGGTYGSGIPTATGGRYNPSTDLWSDVSLGGVNIPTDRYYHTAVWTGSEMIVWGGWGGDSNPTSFNTGGRYSPASDMWTPTSTGANVPSLRNSHTAVWTGSKMIIWGGQTNNGNGYLSTGAEYDPTINTWFVTNAGANVPSARASHSAIWTGTEMIIWGGNSLSGLLNDGAAYLSP